MIIFLYIALSFIFLVLGKLISKKTFLDREFQRPFECGFSTFNDHRIKFSLHFFLIALVFIIFDVELILLFPFLNSLSAFTPLSGVILFIRFIFILTLGLINE